MAQDFEFDKNSGKAVPSFIGELKLSKGLLKKKVANSNLAVTKGTKFYKTDTLITENSSLARILMIDESILTIGANSEFHFSQFEFKDKENRNSIYELIKGQTRAHIKNKAKEGDIQFKTTFTSLGVRGTEFLINLQKLKDMEIIEFALLNGEVNITTDKKEEFHLSKEDHLILVRDSKGASAYEKIKLSENMIEQLNIEDSLLPYLNIKNLDISSKLYKLVNNITETTGSTSSSSPSEETKNLKDDTGPAWEKNLKKLNDHLKENQKKNKNEF